MTKEDIEHNHIKEIAEKYVQETWGTFLDLYPVDLVLAGIGVAKIKKKKKDERITELEQQIEQMKCCGNCVHDINEDNVIVQTDYCNNCFELCNWQLRK